GGDWTILNNATLKFDTTNPVDILASDGVITITKGFLDIDQTLKFAGGIDIKGTGGSIDVATGKTLTISGRIPE
ncbi:MAG: hypothetical protein IID36_05130, partial [Planctomycetes bacterium]|nr:hypothetical protein [Planctomycetota bacterium]